MKLITMPALIERHMLRALKAYKGSPTRAAEAIDVGRATMYRFIRKYKIKTHRMKGKKP